jgi:hypothetical protein
MKITDIKKEIVKLKSLLSALQKKPRSLNEQIFQKYIQLESTPKVAKYFRQKGVRIPRDTSFQPGDISDVIKNCEEGIDPILLEVAQEIFVRNTRSVQRRYW